MKNIFKILVFTFIIFVGSELVNKKEAQAACTITSGVVDATDVSSGCETTPAAYEITVYNIYLCTSAPTAPTTTSAMDLSNCSTVFENSSGATATLTQGGTVSLSGTATIPPPGTYTHGLVYMDNIFKLTAAFEFSASQTGLVSGSGVYCATSGNTGTTSSSGDHSNNSICDSSPVTAQQFTEILNSFDSTSFDATASATNINSTGVNMAAYLVDADTNLSANDSDSDRLFVSTTFASNIEATTSTSQVGISFNVGEGMFLGDDGSGNLQMGTGPFQMTIFVQ